MEYKRKWLFFPRCWPDGVLKKVNDLLSSKHSLTARVLCNVRGLWRFSLGDSNLIRFLAKNQHAKRKTLFFKNWHSTEPRKARHDFRKWSFSFLRKMKQIFCETGRSIENLITKIYFEVVGYNFEAIMVIRSVQVPLSLHTYSYVNFQNNIISC